MISKFDDFFKRHNYYIQISGLDSKKLMVNEIDIDISELRSIRDFIIGLGGRISYIKGCFCSQQDGGYIFINKLNDDWYILEYRGKSFKCDQIEGLYKCIQDICFSIKLDESVDNGCNLYGKVSKF
jgi:hypothetical protein